MDQNAVAAVVASLKAKHPDVVNHLRALCASDPTVGTPIMQFLLETFDAREQLLWQMRDLIGHRDVVGDGSRIYFLKYGANDMVRRIVSVTDLPPGGMPYPLKDHSHE